MTTSLFNSPSTGTGGSKYENIADGLYRGTLVRFEEGPTFYDTKAISDEYPQGKPQPKVRWVWKIASVDGKDLGEEISELTSKATGERSTAAKFFTAHLGRQFDNRTMNVEEAVAESMGKTVLLSVTTKTSGYRRVDAFLAN